MNKKRQKWSLKKQHKKKEIISQNPNSKREKFKKLNNFLQKKEKRMI